MAAQPNKGTGEASAGLPRPPGCARHKGMARQSEASLAMSRKGWSQRPEYFQARTKYLQLADKAARTVMMLTERLDHHRGRGPQQIVVKHITVNADQAMVAETITTAPALQASSRALLEQVNHPELVRGGGGQKSK